jgi:hypothetical protein
VAEGSKNIKKAIMIFNKISFFKRVLQAGVQSNNRE